MSDLRKSPARGELTSKTFFEGGGGSGYSDYNRNRFIL